MREKNIYQPIIDYLLASGHYAGYFESSAALGSKKSMRRRQYVPKGWPDISGYFRSGVAILIEVKAPNQLAFGLKLNQLLRLLDAIESGCFACVVDGVPLLRDMLEEWRDIESPIDRRLFLLTHLPQKYNVKGRRFLVADRPEYIRLKNQLLQNRCGTTADAQ